MSAGFYLSSLTSRFHLRVRRRPPCWSSPCAAAPQPSSRCRGQGMDDLFCNGQIHPIRLAAALLQPQQPHRDAVAPGPGAVAAEEAAAAASTPWPLRAPEGAVHVPVRTHWRSSPAPAPQASAPENEPAADEVQAAAVTPATSRSSSSSSTASSALSPSSSSSMS
ncbi:predicted GPI-anchored protein 58 isoform X1 [Panicum hallii]|uniref:predicted GPI-anchored protein 58 isoform X1 n=1 Tax=Panicum hallii TaxID=206008 RepID=UPI000DF4E662|nr:predicted GPI-anchored protein 58 isoform X1 [Panicum hallii]